MADAPDFDRDQLGLHRYTVEERLGYIFLSFSNDPTLIDDYLGDTAAVHSPWPLEGLVTTRRRELTVECNWKAFLEVFNEYYHIPYVHPDSIDDVYGDPEPQDDSVGAFASQYGSTEGTGALLQDEQTHDFPPMSGLSDAVANGVRYTWVFPNITFAASPEALWGYEAYPLGPNRCHVVQTSCLPAETISSQPPELIEAYHDRLDAALAEDIPVLEQQHVGLASPEAQTGPLHPLLEPNVASFAEWYRGEVGERFD